jgi:predicted GIY-YIG superfamily endonuclease
MRQRRMPPTRAPSRLPARPPAAPSKRGSSGWWFVYLLRCADVTLYAGSTTDVDERVRAHNAGRGAKYTAGRRPVAAVYREACETRSAALRREHALKRLTRAGKETLIRRS